MPALLLLLLLTLLLHRWLLEPLAGGLQALLEGHWAVWVLLLLGLWLFTGPRQRP